MSRKVVRGGRLIGFSSDFNKMKESRALFVTRIGCFEEMNVKNQTLCPKTKASQYGTGYVIE